MAAQQSKELFETAMRKAHEAFHEALQDARELEADYTRLKQSHAKLEAIIAENANRDIGPSPGFIAERDSWRRRALEAEERLAKIMSVLPTVR